MRTAILFLFSITISSALFSNSTSGNISIGGYIFNDQNLDCNWSNETAMGVVEVIVEGCGFGPVTTTSDFITGYWQVDNIPDCSCLTVSIPATMFDSMTGILANHVNCGTAAAWDEFNISGISNNGSDGIPNNVVIDCFPVTCGSLPDDNGNGLYSLDFGFTFPCSTSNTLQFFPNCETSTDTIGCDPGDYNYLCQIEFLDEYCARMDPVTTNSGPDPLCNGANDISHNTYWISFIAGDDAQNFDMEIQAANCLGGGGIQWGVVSNCDFDTVICDADCSGENIHHIVTDLLIPGEQYHLWIDGCNNDVCDLEFTINSGGGPFTYPLIEVSECNTCLSSSQPNIHIYELQSDETDQLFCVDAIDNFYDNSSNSFYWNLDSDVDGVPSNSDMDGNLGSTQENCISLDFDENTYPPGEYELCMTWVGSCCDHQGPFCLTIIINENVQEPIEYFADVDQDNFGDPNDMQLSSTQPNGYVLDNTDCDDTNPNINPDADDIPNNDIDEDCDGLDATSGTYEINGSTIKLFPNPSSGLINLEVDMQMDFTVNIYDIQGNNLLSQGNSPIDLSPYANGIYILSLTTNGETAPIVDRIVLCK